MKTLQQSQINKKPSGNTLIEVLITLVIMGIGLLGVAQMQTLSLKSNYESDQRILASNLVNDILSRLRSVPLTDLNTSADSLKEIDLSGSGTLNESCSVKTPCNIADKIQKDIDDLTGSSDLYNASACISITNTNYLSIVIAWDGIGKTKIKAKDQNCGTVSDKFKRRSLTVNAIL